MKRVMFLVALSALATIGCKKAETSSEDDLKPAKVVRENAPVPAPSGAPHGGAGTQAAPAAAGQIAGAVLETMNSGGYTYVKVKGPEGDIWAAGPETVVQVGDQVSFAPEMPMQGFHSKTLDRTFDVVYFVSSLGAKGGAPAAAGHGSDPHAGMGSDGGMAAPKAAAPAAAVAAVAKVEGGKNIAEIFAGKAELSGKEVSVRGTVVKFNAGIMGRNWIHIQDGSGAAGTNDLTVTTDAVVELGDTVVIKGTVGTDRDFGAGYAYDVIIESATVSK